MALKTYYKITILLLTFFGSTAVQGQSKEGSSYEFLNQITKATIILSERGIIRGADAVNTFKSELIESGLKERTYEKKFSIEVTTDLAYEIGEIRAQSKSFSVMLVQKKDSKTGPKFEFLVIYNKESANAEATGIDAGRTRWMELCNAHLAVELVKELYTADAFYYNRGRLLQGTEELSAEYSYMNSPTYSLKLTPKHVAFVADKIAFEIGQCSGSYPLPYILLWEKQSDGRWQVRMDSNY